jgi:energy-coupling factor transporter transmembrane protein EcfT
MPAEAKILGLAMFSVMAIAIPASWLAALAIVLLSFIVLSKANIAKMWRMFLPAIPFIVFICVAQALLAGGNVMLAAESAARMALLYLAGSAVTVTTTEPEFVTAIERFFSPLDRLLGSGLGRDISTMMMLALAFMPAIAEEYASIKMAQEARGVSYGGPVKALKGIFSIAVPMLYSLSARADSVAMAMESRCYGLKDTKFQEGTIHKDS